MWLCMSVNVTLFDSDSDWLFMTVWVWFHLTVPVNVTVCDSDTDCNFVQQCECDFIWHCRWMWLCMTVPVTATSYNSASECDRIRQCQRIWLYVTVSVTVLEKRTNFFPMAVFRCRSTKENTSHLMLSQRNWTLKWCTIQWCLRSVQWCMAQCCLRSGQWCMIPCCLKLVQ